MLNLEKVRNAQECISAYDQQLNITLWNPAMEKRTGVAEKEALGKCFLDLFPHTRNDQRTKFLNIAMSTDQSFFFPNMIYLYLQPFTYYTQYIQPLKQYGKVIGVINIVRDHTIEAFFSQEDFIHFFDADSSASLLYDKDRADL